jgi:hypothetical protein
MAAGLSDYVRSLEEIIQAADMLAAPHSWPYLPCTLPVYPQLRPAKAKFQTEALPSFGMPCVFVAGAILLAWLERTSGRISNWPLPGKRIQFFFSISWRFRTPVIPMHPPSFVLSVTFSPDARSFAIAWAYFVAASVSFFNVSPLALQISAAPVLEDPDLEAQLFADFAAEDAEAKLSRHAEPEWAVATALYRECHATRGTLTVGNLTFGVSEVLLGNDENYQLSPRKVGAVRRSLGLNTEKLGNQGRGFRLTNEFVSRVHKLALDLGINKSHILPYTTVDAGYAGAPCSFCDHFGLLTRSDGTKLRSVASGIPRRRRGLFG